MDDTILAVAYYTNGANFELSAKMLARDLELDAHGRPARLTAIPLFFLASHAAELYLKAALLKRGFGEPALRQYDYRHNLDALLAAAARKRCTGFRHDDGGGAGTFRAAPHAPASIHSIG